MVTVVPSPGALPMEIEPPCSSTIFLTEARPQTDTGALRGEKRLKDFIDDFRRNRSPVVLDEDLVFHAAPRAMLGDLYMEMPSGVHRFARVPENTQKDLLEFGFVAADGRDHRCVVLGHLYPGDFEVGRDDRERALDYFGNADEPTIQLERFRKIQNLVQDGFDPDQIAHRILDARLWVEIEDAFTSDFFQLSADRSERLAHFCRQEHAELADRCLSLLFSDDGFRGTWSDCGSGRACWSSGGRLAGWSRRRSLENIRDLHNRRLKRTGIRLLITSGFFRCQGDGPAHLSADEERHDERGVKPVLEQILSDRGIAPVWRRDRDPREAYDGGSPTRRLNCRARGDGPA